MDIPIFENMHGAGIISERSMQKIKARQLQPISVQRELTILVYAGVLLLTGGLGIVVYKNIDSIGHQIILFAIAGISAVSFGYCLKTKNPFSHQKVSSPNFWFDYVLLMGCLTVITFIGYLQYQYNVFGDRYGLVTFIPMLLLFFCAYFFDHKGILSMAIVNLAAWAGIAITPTRILKENDFNSASIISTGLLLSILLILAGVLTKKRNIKGHFEFTYSNFGMHLLFISCLAAMFTFGQWYVLWFMLLAGIGFYFYKKALAENSFYYLLFLSLYCYIGISNVVVRLLTTFSSTVSVYLVLLYFIASALLLVFFLISMNKKIKAL